MKFWVVWHDCHIHDDDGRMIGPFEERDHAAAFIDRHGLERPSDGGYAFAVVVPPRDGDHDVPAVWDAEKAISERTAG